MKATTSRKKSAHKFALRDSKNKRTQQLAQLANETDTVQAAAERRPTYSRICLNKSLQRPCVEDVMRIVRQMWNLDPFTGRSTQTEDREFREFFGCGCIVFLSLWGMLVTTGLVLSGGTFEHLLWTLYFLKCYPKERTGAKVCGTEHKTMAKWVWLFIAAIACLEPLVVSFLFKLVAFPPKLWT